MYVCYRWIFEIPRNKHRVEFYEEYGQDGLDKLYDEMESTRKSEIMKFVKSRSFLTRAQKDAVDESASRKPQFIVFDEEARTLESY